MDISKLHSELHQIARNLFRAEHQAAGAEPDKDREAFDEAARRRRELGRYTLEEAAVFIAIVGIANPRDILGDIEASIAQGKLNSYLPGESGIFRGDGITRAWREEVYDNDMNAWLKKNQKRIGRVFPIHSVKEAKRTSNEERTIGPKTRYRHLDETIDRAIKLAHSTKPKAIFEELLAIIRSGVKIGHFTGEIEPVDGPVTKMRLRYINENNNEKLWFTYDAFRQRISERMQNK